MASLPCGIQARVPVAGALPGCHDSHRLGTSLLASRKGVGLGWLGRSAGMRRRFSGKLEGGGGGGATCWFRLGGRDAEGAGVYGSQSRDDFDRDDVEQYFNYMGMLAVEGTYDKMEALLDQNIHPVDILLMLAASEGDRPKIEELLRAGARYDIKDADGNTALDRAAGEDIKELILGFSPTKA